MRKNQRRAQRARYVLKYRKRMEHKRKEDEEE